MQPPGLGLGWASRRGEEQPAGPWLSPELPPNLDPCPLGPQAPPSSFLWPRSFSRREGPPLGTGAGVLLEVGAGTPQGQGLSPEGCPWAGGWRGGGHLISVAGLALIGTPNPPRTGWGGTGLVPQRARSEGSRLGGAGGIPAPRGGRGRRFPSAGLGSAPSPGRLAPRPRLRPAGSAAGPRPCNPFPPGGSGPCSPPGSDSCACPQSG